VQWYEAAEAAEAAAAEAAAAEAGDPAGYGLPWAGSLSANLLLMRRTLWRTRREVVTVDKTSKKIGIKLSGTVGPTTAPTPFNVRDAP
jgi:hypothetical protein